MLTFGTEVSIVGILVSILGILVLTLVSTFGNLALTFGSVAGERRIVPRAIQMALAKVCLPSLFCQVVDFI